MRFQMAVIFFFRCFTVFYKNSTFSMVHLQRNSTVLDTIPDNFGYSLNDTVYDGKKFTFALLSWQYSFDHPNAENPHEVTFGTCYVCDKPNGIKHLPLQKLLYENKRNPLLAEYILTVS